MSTYIVPLPQSVRDRLDENTHPGLLLDKYVPSWSETLPPDKLSELVQKPAVAAVVGLTQQEPKGLDYPTLLKRRSALLVAEGTRLFSCTTTGPLTLHLARASALENAGICLHPVYGFTYLPGTGLKGMARAFAETVWFPTQFVPDEHGKPCDDEQRRRAEDAWQAIERVFGWAPNSDAHKKRWKPDTIPQHGEEHLARSGAIVFHDAWPEKWPALFADILNSHHREYYGADDQNVPPPGDWETPVVVSFLAVSKDQTFSFGLSARRGGVNSKEQKESQDLLDLAGQWLRGALVYEGAGAKTAAGYGGFKYDGEDTSLQKAWSEAQERRGQKLELAARRAEQRLTLELVTPGFFAGQHQFESEGPAARDDCRLRSSTLRGQLRWWWRTMHAAHVDPATLRRLEAAVWGDTKSGGAVRVSLVAEDDDKAAPRPFNRDDIVRLAELHQIRRPPKTTFGLTYHSYGMDERDRRRYYVAPGARWTVALTARPSRYARPDAQDDGPRIELGAPQLLLEQAQAALWLLCHFGGVGAKSRKGFGCFADPADLSTWDLDKCKRAGDRFRQACRLGSAGASTESSSPALEHMLQLLDIDTPWENYWFALDRVGAAAQQFAKAYKRDPAKKALGLPRRVGASSEEPFKPGSHVKTTNRHTSPVFYHAWKASDGTYGVRVTAFPSSELPNFNVSREFLGLLRAPLQSAMTEFKREFPMDLSSVMEPSSKFPDAQRAAADRPQPSARLPKPGDRVTVELLPEKTKKGGWTAKYAPANLSGPIQNSAEVPDDKQPGDKLELIVASCNPKQIAFRHPKPGKAQYGSLPKWNFEALV